MPIALVTGASAGFGTAICRTLIGAGLRVIGAARRAERLAALQAELGANFLPLAFDLQDKAATQAALASLPESWREIDLLVNNAGLALGIAPAQETDLADWEQMVATNISGLIRLTRLLLPGMVARNRGMVINIGSVAGTYPYAGGNVYGASKAFVRQFSLGLRADLAGTQVRVTNLEPGLCDGTEFSDVRFHGDHARARAMYAGVRALMPEDIARTILWLWQQPDHVNINRIEMMPVAQSPQALRVVKGLGE